MRSAFLFVAAVAGASLLAGDVRAAPGATAPRVGPHFRVLCHFDDDAAADAALETVEAAWPFASELFGLSAEKLDPPLDVHLYRTTAEYVSVDAEITGGKFAKNLAFSSYDTRSSYVAVQPEVADETLAAVGISAQTRHNLAHEATHLVSYRACPCFRSIPQWASEGAAVWCEEETLAARGWSAGVDADPYVATKACNARRLLASGRLPKATEILHDGLLALGMHERYSVQALFFRRLVSRKDGTAFRAAFREAARLPEGPDFDRRFFETATAPYAAEGLDGLDLDFEQYVRSRTPAWDESYRSLSTAGDAWAQFAFGDENAVAWRTAPAPGEQYELSGTLEILPPAGKVRQMNVLLSQGDGGFVSVAFVAGYGVDVFQYRRAEDKWEKLATASTKAVQLWRRLPFRISVDGAKLAVRVDGTEVASAEAKDHAMTGPWGLGVQAGGAGIWRRLSCEPTKR